LSLRVNFLSQSATQRRSRCPSRANQSNSIRFSWLP